MAVMVIPMEMILMSRIRTYTELSKLSTYEERYEYLRLDGVVGEETFGFDRYLNQRFYQNDPEWLQVRDYVIMRDRGCDLGVEGYDIPGNIIVHHMNPVTKYDLINRTEFLLNPDYLISTASRTHNAIHYGNENLLMKGPVQRTKNDTCPWRK